MTCDHIIGSHGTRLLRVSEWQGAISAYAGALNFFGTTKLAVPFPGYIHAHAYCADCGTKLDEDLANGQLQSAVANPHAGSDHDRESFYRWLDSITSAA